ncbi:MAG: DUF6264 family protein [Leucobacter sp.]
MADNSDKRPKPEYGEYAPEGWEWKPEGAEDSAQPSDASPSSQTAKIPSAQSTPGTLPGVPHNLGAGSSLPARNAAAPPRASGRTKVPDDTTQASSGGPYRANATTPPASQHRSTPLAQQSNTRAASAQPKRPSALDKIVTILLLVVGIFGALQMALAMMGLDATFRLIGAAPGFEEFSVPAWLDPTGKVIGIALLAFYGIVLVYSIRRLRAGKLTFWAPLAAGVIVTVLVLAVVMIAILTTPDLVNILGNPEKSTELIEYLQGRSL